MVGNFLTVFILFLVIFYIPYSNYVILFLLDNLSVDMCTPFCTAQIVHLQMKKSTELIGRFDDDKVKE